MSLMTAKTIFITGASSGIGAACAKIFAAAQARVIITARRKDRLEQLAHYIKDELKAEVLPLCVDVCDAEQVKNIKNSLPANWQKIDVLINNAGLALGMDKIQDGHTENWDRVIDTNIKGLLYMTRAILPGMLAENSGHIINIGSIAGHEVYPGGNVYAASKHAVRAISKSLLIDVLNTPIRVSSIDPGAVKTEFSTVRFFNDEKKAEGFYEGFMPLRPEDIADAALYCATRPAHVDVSEMVILPTHQASANHVHRTNN